MDRIQLIKHLADLNPQLKAKEAEMAVKVILEALCASLAKGGRVEIRGFGSFSLSASSPQRDSRGKKLPVKYSPQFKPAKELRERVGDCLANREIAIPFEVLSGQHVVLHPVESVDSHV